MRAKPSSAGLILFVVALALQACGSNKLSSRTPTETGTPGPATPAVRSPTLATERQWLLSWFQGTPVTLGPVVGNGFTIELPREHSFATGQSQPRPALMAVLDKLTQSMGRLPPTRLLVAAAPGDGSGATPLALQRADQIRVYLLQRGISPTRLPPSAASPGTTVQLRLAIGGQE